MVGDDFETAAGWTTNRNRTDTATSNARMTVPFTQAGVATKRAGAWDSGSSICTFAGQFVRILVERAEAATGSLGE